MRPSAAWLGMRQTPSGQTLLRDLVRQTLEGLAALHARNITHRDLKPSNVIVRMHDAPASGTSMPTESALAASTPASATMRSRPSLRLADFGSAIDAEVLQPHVGLYPEGGPSTEEETYGYQPPEATIGNAPFSHANPISYDLWSMGILLLELLLGTPHVLPLSSRAEAVLRLRFASSEPTVLRRLLIANALAEHCIVPPRAEPTQAHGGTADASTNDASSPPPRPSSSALPTTQECSKAHFAAAVSRTDPLGELGGAPLDMGLVDLAYEMLKWDPDKRMSAAAALQHPAMLDTSEVSTPVVLRTLHAVIRSRALVCAGAAA